VKRIVFDTNLIVSAFQFGGKPMEVLQMAVDGEIILVFSKPILDETLRILRDKFGYSATRLNEVTGIIETCGIRITPTQKLDVVPSDSDDNKIIECAVAGVCEAVITGDKDLLRLGTYEGIKILRVGEFLQRGST
jgi:putative PIN family toxin of toxin-antitoxin system